MDVLRHEKMSKPQCRTCDARLVMMCSNLRCGSNPENNSFFSSPENASESRLQQANSKFCNWNDAHSASNQEIWFDAFSSLQTGLARSCENWNFLFAKAAFPSAKERQFYVGDKETFGNSQRETQIPQSRIFDGLSNKAFNGNGFQDGHETQALDCEVRCDAKLSRKSLAQSNHGSKTRLNPFGPIKRPTSTKQTGRDTAQNGLHGSNINLGGPNDTLKMQDTADSRPRSNNNSVKLNKSFAFRGKDSRSNRNDAFGSSANSKLPLSNEKGTCLMCETDFDNLYDHWKVWHWNNGNETGQYKIKYFFDGQLILFYACSFLEELEKCKFCDKIFYRVRCGHHGCTGKNIPSTNFERGKWGFCLMCKIPMDNIMKHRNEMHFANKRYIIKCIQGIDVLLPRGTRGEELGKCFICSDETKKLFFEFQLHEFHNDKCVRLKGLKM